MKLSGKTALVLAVPVFLVGGWFGQVIEPDPPPEYVVTEVPGETKTVTETETEYIQDPACIEAARLAKEIAGAAARIDLATPKLLEIMSQLRIAVALGDSNAANDLETRLRRIDSKIISSSEVLGTERGNLALALEECNS